MISGELRADRADIVKRCRVILGKADAAGRSLTAEEAGDFDRAYVEVRNLERKIEAAEGGRYKTFPGTRGGGASDSLPDQKARRDWADTANRGLSESMDTLPPPRNDPEPDDRYYGSALRSRPAWEHQYARQNWDAETRAVRTPEADMESLSFIRAVVANDQAMLREIAERPHNRAEHRADLGIGAAAAGTGGGAVPAGFSSAIQLILARTARLRRFCNVIPGNEFNQKVPVQGTKTVAAKHAEAGDMTVGVTEPTYTSVLPEAVKLGAIVKFSRELLDDSPLPLINEVTRDIGEAVGTLEDLSILDGTNFTDSLFADAATGTATWTDLTETLATLTTKYYELGSVFRANATWLINEATAAVLTAITATDGRPMLQEFNPAPRTIDDVGGQVGSLLGRPVLVFPTGATGVPADEGFFGDLSGYTLYLREDLRAESSPDVDFDTDQVALRVSRRIDGIISQSGRMLRFA